MSLYKDILYVGYYSYLFVCAKVMDEILTEMACKIHDVTVL